MWVGGGSFRSGSDDWNDDDLPGSPFSKEDEIPGAWTVEGFWIQQHEVTNEEYARFNPNHAFPKGQENRPVANVTWEEAMAYARALGGSLPSEVHWEFAARGPERRSYPWGNDQPTCARAHFRDCEPPSTIDVTTRAGDMTPDGVYDLAGNVREWVAPVWFDPTRHPVNHETRRIKGGSFSHPAFFLRSAAVSRHLELEESWESVGFRVSWETVASRR